MEEKKKEHQPAFQTDCRYAIVAEWLIIPAIMIIFNIVSLILFFIKKRRENSLFKRVEVRGR